MNHTQNKKPHIILSESLFIFEAKENKQFGAGILPICKKSGKILLQKRGRTITYSNTWANWGGMAEKGETPKQTALREFEEESGYKGSIHKIQHLFTDQKKNGFKFYNYLAIVPKEFKPPMVNKKTVDGDIEVQDYQWVSIDEIENLKNLHFGMKKILRNQKNKIIRYIQKHAT